MRTIEITEECKTGSDVSEMLRHIADLIERGYERGFSPDWELSGEDENEDNEKPADLSEEATIYEAKNGYCANFCGTALGAFEDFDDAFAALKKSEEGGNYHPNYYFINERGSVDWLDHNTGNAFKSWV